MKMLIFSSMILSSIVVDLISETAFADEPQTSAVSGSAKAPSEQTGLAAATTPPVVTLMPSPAGNTPAPIETNSSKGQAAPMVPNIQNTDSSTVFKDERAESIKFDDEVVEGMNKNPFDSLMSIGRVDNKAQRHLYRKKNNFRYELKLTTRGMGLIQ